MIRVKQLFGMMLLAAAIYLLSRILPDWVVMCLWSGLFVLAAVFIALGSDWGSEQFALLRMRQGLVVLALVYAGLLTVGAVSGSGDPLNPLAKVFGDEQHLLKFRRVGNVRDLDAMLAVAKRDGQPVMLDFYADWCITCKQLEAQTFTDPGVQAALENTLLLQVDVTAYNHEHKALLARYNLLGPPAILFFNLQSNEIRAQRIIGFMDVVDLKRTIDQALRI